MCVAHDMPVCVAHDMPVCAAHDKSVSICRLSIRYAVTVINNIAHISSLYDAAGAAPITSDGVSSSYWTVYKIFASQSQRNIYNNNFLFPAKQKTA